MNGKKLTAIPNLDEVVSVYSGRNGKCCCGCAGRHYTASANRELRGKLRGYPIKDKEINDRMVKKVVGLLRTARPEKITFGGNNVSTVVGSRLYIAYIA